MWVGLIFTFSLWLSVDIDYIKHVNWRILFAKKRAAKPTFSSRLPHKHNGSCTECLCELNHYYVDMRDFGSQTL